MWKQKKVVPAVRAVKCHVRNCGVCVCASQKEGEEEGGGEG